MARKVSYDELRTLTQGNVPVLVDFSAAWCGPCNAMSPIVDALSQELAGKAEVVKVDVDENSQAAAEFMVRGVPTFVVMHRGNQLARRTGSMAPAALRQWLAGAIG